MDAPLLQLEGVSRTFVGEGVETQALEDINLTLGAGEFVCVTGASGSGKTTLMNIMGCLDRPSDGEYRLGGIEVARLDDNGLADLRRDTFGFVFQNYNLLESLTARGNVELPATYTASDGARRRDRAEELLHAFGMRERSDHMPGELSGGEQQRVAIARALMNGARVILADEPTGALDAEQGEQVLALLEDLAGRGHTVIVISHDHRVAARARRRVVLRDGRVVEDSGPRSAPDVALEPRKVRRGGMPWLAAVRGGLISMRSGRLRAALTVFSVALGIWSVVALLALAEGARRDTLAAVERMGANRLSVWGHEGTGTAMRRLPKTLEDSRAIAEQVDNVRTVVPWMMRYLPVRAGSEHLAGVRVRARDDTEPKTYFQNLAWPIEQGAFLNQRDNEEAAMVAVIGPAVRDRLFAGGVDPVGEHIEINGLNFVVKGVLSRRPGFVGEGVILTTDPANPPPGLPFFFGTTGPDLLIPFKTGADVLFGTDELDGLDVLVEDVSRIEETARDIQDLMFRRHGRGGYGVTNEAQTWAAHKKLKGMYAAIFATIAGVALLVGGVGIVSVTLAAVSQRRREIGIRMAVGARRRDISAQFLGETTVLTIIGGVCGVLLALVGTPVLSDLTERPVAFAPWFVPMALACAIAAGSVFGIVPAQRAARLDPVAALASD